MRNDLRMTKFVRVWLGRAVAVVPVLFLLGCGAREQNTLSETFEQSYKVNAIGAVSIRNPNGSVSIRGTAGSEMTVRAIKRAHDQEHLKGIDVNVSILQQVASVTTSFMQAKATAKFGSGQVDYEVTVPSTVTLSHIELDNGKLTIDGMRGEKIQASVVDGQLFLRDCFANLDVTVANGSLELLYDQESQRQFSVDARIMSGGAKISVPRNGAYHFVGETSNGNVINELAEAVEVNGVGTRKINMSLGKKPRSEINLTVTTGDIRIGEAKSVIQPGERSASK